MAKDIKDYWGLSTPDSDDHSPRPGQDPATEQGHREESVLPQSPSTPPAEESTPAAGPEEPKDFWSNAAPTRPSEPEPSQDAPAPAAPQAPAPVPPEPEPEPEPEPMVDENEVDGFASPSDDPWAGDDPWSTSDDPWSTPAAEEPAAHQPQAQMPQTPSVETEALPLVEEPVSDAPSAPSPEEDAVPVAEDPHEEADEGVDDDPADAAPKRKRTRAVRRKKPRKSKKSKKDSGDLPEGARPAKSEQKQAIGPTFEVPRPGGRLKGGRKKHQVWAGIGLVSAALLAAIALVAFTAVVLMPKDIKASLSDEEKQSLRLDSFPTDAAASFAVRYATECLNFDGSKQEAREERRQRLAGFGTKGVDPDCGWNGQGKQTLVGTPFWDGTVSPVSQFPDNARWLGIQAQVSTNEGDARTVRMSIPVYTDDPGIGNHFKAIGNPGQVPLSAQADVPSFEKPASDAELSRTLQTDLIGPFFAAWAKSDEKVLSRYISPEAADTARSGLNGTAGEPEVTSTEVFFPGNDDSYVWQVGDTAQAEVNVEWKNGDSTVQQSYRLTLARADTGWFITNVDGAVLDPTGSED